MPRTLVTDWKRVATSGKTKDGRTIDAQDLRDMAESYDPEFYTAVIWFEHIRYMGNFGTVAEVKAEDVASGKVTLFAKLKPNDKLLQLNKEAQKLFGSIEIEPDFAGTGKAYLGGLAVTDEPASIGTEALHFSHRAKHGNHFGSLEPLDDLIPTEAPDESARSFFTRLFNALVPTAPADLPLPEPETTSMDPKTAAAFTAAVEKLGTLATSLEASATTFAAQKPPVKTETEKPAASEKPTKTESVPAISAEQFNELKGSLDKLTENFNTAVNQGKGKTVPPVTGAGDAEEEVY
jgi:hypothetical protein